MRITMKDRKEYNHMYISRSKRYKNGHKRGQITIIIILGILLLFSTFIIFYIKYYTQKDSIEDAHTKSDAESEDEALILYVETCLYDTAKEGLKVIGFSGGYYNASKYGLYSKPGNPTESDILKFSDNNPIGVAYWWHFKSSNSCTTDCSCGSNKPALYKSQGDPSVENELKQYIEGNIGSCLSTFSEIKQFGFDVETKGNPDVTTYVNDDGVKVSMDYTIILLRGSEKYIYDKYETTLNVKLREIFDLATEVIDLEQEFTFFERFMINLLAVYSMPGPRADRLPPMSAQTIDVRTPVFWKLSDVRDRIEDALVSNVPLFQGDTTRNYLLRIYPDNNIRTGLYNMPTIYLEENYTNLDMKFRYLDWWPIYLQIKGRGAKGEIIMPDISTTPFPWMMFQRYNYYYDISTPILMEIYDPDAFKGEGYRFYVALESNIRRNKPMNCTGPGIREHATDFGPMICKEIHRNSGPINISFNNIYTNESIENVILSYSCGVNSCFLGVLDSVDDGESVTIKLPSSCVGGFLSAQADGYMSDQVPLNTFYNVSGEAKLDFMKKQKINVTIKQKAQVRTSNNWSFSNSAQWLLKNEVAVVHLTRISDQENPYTVSMYYEGDQTEPEVVELYPGKYKMEINQIYQLPTPYGQESINIPAIDDCVGGDLFTDCQEIHIDGMQINNSFISGGVIFDSPFDNVSNYYIEITPDDLYNSQEMIIYSFGYFGQEIVNDKLTYDDLGLINMNSEFSKRYGHLLRPEFINKTSYY
ncbi:hypothetical protein K9M79_05560 [Candidatus Woesearchaeota archaeon]|nr:hypothetical protein [Candidatus Woesearchaeota archaeon]